MIALAQRKVQLIGQAEDRFAARCGLAVLHEAQMPRRDPRLEGEFELAQVLKTASGDALRAGRPRQRPLRWHAYATVGRGDLHPARNIHLLVDAFPPSPQYHPSQPYTKEDDENAWRRARILEGENGVTHMHYLV